MNAYELGYNYRCVTHIANMEDNPYEIYSNNWYDWNEGFSDADYGGIKPYHFSDDDCYTDEDRPY